MVDRQLIKILFKYPTDNTDETPSPNILPCLQEIVSYLEDKGINCSLQRYKVNSRGRSIEHANLLAFNQKLKGPFILLQGHLDTVPFIKPYKFSFQKGYLVGRGGVDMKGSLAGIIDAFVKESEKGTLMKYPPALLITGDEEANNFVGIKKFLTNQNIQIYFAINGEPTNFEVGLRFFGVLGYELEKIGLGGHSASRDNDYLIEKITPVVHAINEFLKLSRNIFNKNFGKTIGAFTVLNAGMKANQLPEKIKINWNLRTVEVKKHYEKIFQSTISKIIDKNIKIKCFDYDPIEGKINQTIQAIFKTAFSRSKIKYKEKAVEFFTEASLLNRNNILAITCGPGDPNLAHMQAEKEKIKINDIKKYSRLLQNIINSANGQT